MDVSFLKKEEYQAWVPFEDGVEVLVRFVPRDLLIAIGKQSIVTSLNPETRKEEKEYDALAADVKLGQAAVVDWRGMTNGDEAFLCTPENVALLMEKWDAFARFINRACADVRLLGELQKETTEKN